LRINLIYFNGYLFYLAHILRFVQKLSNSFEMQLAKGFYALDLA